MKLRKDWRITAENGFFIIERRPHLLLQFEVMASFDGQLVSAYLPLAVGAMGTIAVTHFAIQGLQLRNAASAAEQQL